MLYASGALVAWAMLSFFVRLAVRGAPLLKTTAAMSTSNATLVGLLVWATLPPAALVPTLTRTYVLIVVVGLSMVALSRLSYYYAIRLIGPSRTIPVAASTPAVTAFGAALTLAEPLTIRMLIGLAVFMAGIYTVVRSSAPSAPEGGEADRRRVMLGYLMAGLTTLNWSCSGIMVKFVALDVGPLAASALIIWVGIGFAWSIAAGFEKRDDAGRLPRIPRGNWRWIGLGSLCQTIAIPCYSAGLAYTLAVNVTAITSLQPLIVILGSRLFLQHEENITGGLVLGVCMSITGTLLILL